MRLNSVAYDNLRAEMARQNIGIKDIAEQCGYNRDTLSRKLAKKTDLALSEASYIQHKMFPNLDIRYLFDIGKNTEK